LRAKVGRKDEHVRTRRLLTAVVTAAAVALAGCGSSGPLSKAQYEQRLQKSGRELAAALAQLSRSNSRDEFKSGVDGVEKALNDTADNLDGITPPDDVQSANARLVDGFRKLAKDFEQVKAAADEGPDAARQKGRQVTTGAASREANQAIKEIQRRGYDVGELGRS
jgi:outer membrane murein-binding lipoprotein Lpp